jgi:hypothetical protein
MKRLALLVALTACGGNGDGNDPGPCANVAGTWEVSGCGDDECVIAQTGCSTSLDCDSGTASYSGSVSGSNVSFAGRNAAGLQATCGATVNGSSMSGTCTSAGLPSCGFSASRQ